MDDIPGFLARIQAGDEEAARELLTPLRGGGPAGRAPAVAPAAAVAVRLARLPPERLGELLPAGPDRADRLRGFAAPGRVPGLGGAEQGDRRVSPRRRARSRTCTARSRSGPTATAPATLAAATDTPSEVARRARPSAGSATCCPRTAAAILELKAEGLSSREIGERLGISERTVQRVLEDLRRRARSRSTREVRGR